MTNETMTDMRIEQDSDSIKIKFDDVKPSEKEPWFVANGGEDAGSELYFSLRNQNRGVTNPKKPSSDAYANCHPSELATVAFDRHFGYVLTPHDVLAHVLLDFGEYVNRNPEQCAPIFNGDPSNKRKVTAKLNPGESLRDFAVLQKTLSSLEGAVVKEMAYGLPDHIHPDLSTADPITNAVLSGVVMGAAKHFVDYESITCCGIPEITLYGTKGDWEKVGSLVTALSTVPELKEVADYYNWLNETVVGNIQGTYDGKENHKFWQSMVHHRGGSGSETKSGWLPSMNLFWGQNYVLPMEHRWTESNDDPRHVAHMNVPAVTVRLNSGEGPVDNVDLSLDLTIGYVGRKYLDGALQPVLGIDAHKAE